MALSQAKLDAHKKLEEAVEALTNAYQKNGEEGILTGYILIVGEVKFTPPEEDDSDDDELTGIIGVYDKRGQNPILSYGLAHEYIRHYNQTGLSD